MNARTEMNSSKRIYSLGVGLFNEVAPTVKISEEIEDEIISYFDMNAILTCARLNNNPWNLRMMAEIKRRKHCVTVYTWLGGNFSIAVYSHEGTGTRGTMGHSALKTYSGGEKNKGEYISFYPAHSSDDNGACKKTISHFHRWHEESRKEAKKIDIYGLDVNAINKRFREICDTSSDSKIVWSNRYNCSDLVLDLLNTGGMLEKTNYNPFNSKSIFGLTIILNILFDTLIESIYQLQFGFKALSSPLLWEVTYDLPRDFQTNLN